MLNQYCRIALASLLLLAATSATANDFTWKASRTLRVPRARTQARIVRSDRLRQVRWYENRIRVAAAEVIFWQRRLEDYEVFRFSDAIRPAHDAAEIELLAAQTRLEALQSVLRATRQRRG